jgi:hypothetical protein
LQIERLLAMTSAHRHRRAQHEQDIADDRTGRRLDDVVQASRRAASAMMSSAALLKVGSEAQPSPMRRQLRARPIQAASGSMARPELTKINR